MSNANDSAFPLAANFIAGDEVTYGLNKRELFAAMAMQGLCAGSSALADCESTSKAMARMAVADADALLAELAKKHPAA